MTNTSSTNNSLQNQTVVLTGASGGIGKACAELLLTRGASLVVTSRDQRKLDLLVPQLKTLGMPEQEVRGLVMDVTNPENVAQAFADIGRFDHLVTPAASATLGPLASMDLAAVEDLMASKLWGQMHCVRAAMPFIKPSGSITLFSGIITQKPFAGGSAYAAVGAAIEAAARVWALEMAPVRINTILPGIIKTSVWQSLLGEDDAMAHLQGVAASLPVGRVGEPTDIAKAVGFLIDNSFVNGTTLAVDGGHRLL